MFSKWGEFVQRHRVLVLIIMVVLVAALGVVGQKLPDYLSQSGWFDPASDSITAADTEEHTFGRDNSADVVVMYDAPAGKTVDDKDFANTVQNHLDQLKKDNPTYDDGIASYWNTHQSMLVTKDKKHAMASIRLKGWGNDILKNYRKIEDQVPVKGVSQHIAGQTPVSGALDTGMAKDIKRSELMGLPIVGILLIIVFGGVLAALLPLLVGGLSIIGSTGILTLISMTTEVNAFAQSCVTLIGLGLAIDYALFIVSRFREEMAEGFDTRTAVTRTIATAGRTVTFSAIMVGVSLSSMLIFPQAFLKSVAYGTISAVLQAAVFSLTILPILLSYLGKHIDALHIGRRKKEPTPLELYNGFWGRISGNAMKHPAATIVPIVLIMLGLALPMGNLQFGGVNETYLPPDNKTRLAQEAFDKEFPEMRTNPVKVVITGSTGVQTGAILAEINQVKGLTGDFHVVKQTPVDKDGKAITVLHSGVVDMKNNSKVVGDIRDKLDMLYSGGGTSQFAGTNMDGSHAYVGGNPALEKDSIDALLKHLPGMAIYMLVAITILMFLTFGSLVLPIKAILMTLLSMASTLGILTLIFIDGVGADALNFTPGPMMSAVLVLIVAILFGLSTDYEVFLVSRMVEAHAAGHSTQESIRFGTASTGRIITAAATIMIVVTGVFGFSEIVMMKYIAFGMVIALFLDATIVRMLLVPAVMRVLGDDNWWAPAGMKRVQHKIGLKESELDDSTLSLVNFATGTELAAVSATSADANAERSARRIKDPTLLQDISTDTGFSEPRTFIAQQIADHVSADDQAPASADNGTVASPTDGENATVTTDNRTDTTNNAGTGNTGTGKKHKKSHGFFGRRRARKDAEQRQAVEDIRRSQREAQMRAQREAQAAAQAAALDAATSNPYEDFNTGENTADDTAIRSRMDDNYGELFQHTDTQRQSYHTDEYETVDTSRPGLHPVSRPTARARRLDNHVSNRSGHTSRLHTLTPHTENTTPHSRTHNTAQADKTDTPSSKTTHKKNNSSNSGSWVDSRNEGQPITTEELMRRLREDNEN